MPNALERLHSAKKIGFLFSGGSMRCIFQVGVVETLYSLGIEPSVCLGVSGGSWNAAAVAAGNSKRLRHYWRFFTRMPYVDLRNLTQEHSPFIWSRLHARAFDRYIREEKIREGLRLYVALTRTRDRASVIMDVHAATDPFRILLASNYLRPFYTHTPEIDGERYGDGGWSDNMPYEFLLEQGCDAVVLMTMKGESEGGLHRHRDDWEHVITDERVIVIRPRYRLPLGFVERRWTKLAPIADLGALRAREVLLGERHMECDLAARLPAPTAYISAIRKMLRRRRVRPTA